MCSNAECIGSVKAQVRMGGGISDAHPARTGHGAALVESAAYPKQLGVKVVQAWSQCGATTSSTTASAWAWRSGTPAASSTAEHVPDSHSPWDDVKTRKRSQGVKAGQHKDGGAHKKPRKGKKNESEHGPWDSDVEEAPEGPWA